MFFDEPSFKERQRIYTANLDTLNKLGTLFSSLGLGSIDRQSLDHIIAENFGPLEERLNGALHKSFKGKLNPVIAEAFDDLASKRIDEFKEKSLVLVGEFNRNMGRSPFSVYTPLDRFDLKEGIFSISETTWEIIKDECSSIIETEHQLTLHQYLVKACEQLTAFWNGCGPQSKDNMNPLNVLDLIEFDEKGFYPSRYNDYREIVK